MHGKYWKFNSWGYPLNLLAKVNSHAYVGLYFEFTLNCSLNVLKSFDVCVTKRVCQCEGIIHVSLLRMVDLKHMSLFPLENDYRHSRTSSCINDVLFLSL